MTPDERCLHRACEAFIGRQGDHEFGELVAAAVALRAARHRPPAVEAWEDGPIGAGMSDKVLVAPTAAYSRAPTGNVAAVRPAGCASHQSCSTGSGTGLASKLTLSAMTCACGVIYEPEHQRRNPAPSRPNPASGGRCRAVRSSTNATATTSAPATR